MDVRSFTFDEGARAIGKHISIPIPDGFEASCNVRGTEFIAVPKGARFPERDSEFGGVPHIECMWTAEPDAGTELPEDRVLSVVSGLAGLERVEVFDIDDWCYCAGSGCTGMIGASAVMGEGVRPQVFVGCPKGCATISLHGVDLTSGAGSKRLAYIAERAEPAVKSPGKHLAAFERACTSPENPKAFVRALAWVGEVVEQLSRDLAYRAFGSIALKRALFVEGVRNGEFDEGPVADFARAYADALENRSDVVLDPEAGAYAARVRGCSEIAELAFHYARRAVDGYALQAARSEEARDRRVMEDAVFDMLVAYESQIDVTVENWRYVERFGNIRLPRGYWDLVTRMDGMCPGFAERKRAILHSRTEYEGRAAFPRPVDVESDKGAAVRSPAGKNGPVDAPKKASSAKGGAKKKASRFVIGMSR